VAALWLPIGLAGWTLPTDASPALWAPWFLAASVGPLFFIVSAAGLAFPNAPALALSRHGEAAGTAAALLGAVQFGVGALSAPLVGILGTGAIGMAAVIAGGMLAANVVLFLIARPWQIVVEGEPAVAVAH